MLRALGYSRGRNPVSPPSGPGQPIRLVAYDQDGKFFIPPEATAALQRIKGPLAVVSVCGRARQGKSYILNQLLGRSSGFVVGPTHRPCTKGLWMWSTPIARTASDGSRYHLLLLDTEGIESYDQTGTYSTQIFSLSVLLSSLFIFNQMGGIDEAALDNLALVTEMTKHIRVKAATSSAHDLAQFSPAFVWLLRDFYLDLSEDGRKITPKEYLESALQPTPGTSRAIQAKNEIRSSICALFPDRDCFQLVRPLNNESELQVLDKIAVEKLRPEFQSGLEALTQLVFSRALPKRMGAATLTGPILASLTLSYIQALNRGAVPTIATSWQSVEEGQCRVAREAGMAAYNKAFDSNTAPEEGLLRAAHALAMQSALSAFDEDAMGTGNVRQQTEAQLKETLQKQFESHSSRVFLAAEVELAEELRSMESQLKGMAQAGAGLEEVYAQLNQLLERYERNTNGPLKWPRLCTFLHSSLQGVIAQVVHSRVTKADQQADQAKERLEAAQRAAAEWKQRAERAEGQQSALQQTVADQSTIIQQRMVVEDTLQGEKDVLTTKLEGMVAKYNDMKGRTGREHAQLEAAEDELQRVRREAAESREQIERMRKQEAKADHLQSSLTAAGADLVAAREANQRLQGELQAARSQAQVHETEAARVEGELRRQVAGGAEERDDLGRHLVLAEGRAEVAEALTEVGKSLLEALKSTSQVLEQEAVQRTTQLVEAGEGRERAEAELASAQEEVQRMKQLMEEVEQKRGSTPTPTPSGTGRKRQRVEEEAGEAAMEVEVEVDSEAGGEGSEMSSRREGDGSETPSKPKPMTKQELTKRIMEAGLGHEIAVVRNPSRAALVAVYEKTLK